MTMFIRALFNWGTANVVRTVAIIIIGVPCLAYLGFLYGMLVAWGFRLLGIGPDGSGILAYFVVILTGAGIVAAISRPHWK